MQNPYEIIKDLEDAICEYTGAPYCTVVDSCTNALAICLEWHTNYKRTIKEIVSIPKHTYVSVPIQIKRAGFDVAFREEDWKGIYQLKPFNIWDCAKRFTSGMWEEGPEVYSGDVGKYMCLSFHRTKILGHTQGGAILHNNEWFKYFAEEMRFDGRTDGKDVKDCEICHFGMHCRMDPGVAAELLVKLSTLPRHNKDLPNGEYPDLNEMDIFK